MAKTSREAWRHYGAVLGFFGAIEDIVRGDVWEEFVSAQKERKYLRQSLKRLIVRGFVKRSSGGWKMTAKGLLQLRRFQHGKSKGKPVAWDGKWRLVSFDVPVEHHTARMALRALLLEFDFLPLQKSVWVSPYATEEAFTELMAAKDLWRYCKLMVADIVEGDEELRRLFKLPSR